MKRVLFIILMIVSIFPMKAQQHISFNGATFGTNVETFKQSLNGAELFHKSYSDEIYKRDLCNGYWGIIMLNSEMWYGWIFTSRKSDTVFRTIFTHGYSNDLQGNLMLLVKTLEEKYGGHRTEPQSNLGVIHDGSYKYQEMLALYYDITDINNNIIGVIRISCAPKGNGGLVELSYTDVVSDRVATNEYNTIMKNSL